ncbi:MAG: FG-GAP-like repeat-containing protein [Pseudomonadota bacterium]|nr:FG-GAP-like repeat-containing protein [Pseudomonadota bacterium]
MLLLLAACTPKTEPIGPGTLTEGERITCADPSARDAAPFDVVALPGEIVASEPQDDVGQYDGAGVAIDDFDKDGLLDLFLPNTGADQLYLGVTGGLFANADDRLPASALDGDRSTGASVADVDGDGDGDLFIADLGAPQEIWLNDAGRFIEFDSGVAGEGWHGVGGTFGDYDGDGDLDLFVINHYEGSELGEGMVTGNMPPGHPDALYENDGTGFFTDVSDLLPANLLGPQFSLAAGWYDIDGDDVPELYVVNDFGSYTVPNQMLRWQGERFEAIPAAAGLDLPLFGMGLGVGDLNDDAIPDFALPSWDQLALLVSTGDAWFDHAQVKEYQPTGEDRHVAWGALLVDIDNDGDLDAPVNFGQLQMPDDIREQMDALGLGNPLSQRDALYIQEADGSFTESAEAWGVADAGVGRGGLAVDLDRDGWLDLVKRDVLGPTRVYHARCGEETWLGIDFESPAVGARVEVTSGDVTRRRWISAGGEGFASGGPMEAHFGLGSAESVDVRVHWPDGVESWFPGVATNQRVRISRE